jgi:hypothetical protein
VRRNTVLRPIGAAAKTNAKAHTSSRNHDHNERCRQTRAATEDEWMATHLQARDVGVEHVLDLIDEVRFVIL